MGRATPATCTNPPGFFAFWTRIQWRIELDDGLYSGTAIPSRVAAAKSRQARS
jgi:hypothetical protein